MIKHSWFYLVALLALCTLVQAACGLGTPAMGTAFISLTAPPAPFLPVLKPTTTPVIPTAAPVLPTATRPGAVPLYVVFNPPGDNDLQNAFIRAANSFGADARQVNDAPDAQTEIAQVNHAIQSGAKGIAIQVFAPAAGLGAALSQAARSGGVVLITLDPLISDGSGKTLPIVRFDDVEMGRNVGEAAAKLLTQSGWLKDSSKKVGVISLEVNGQLSCNMRAYAAKEAIKAAGVADEQIFLPQVDMTENDSQDTTAAILKSHPDKTNWVVFGCTDTAVAGALKAFDAGGVTTDDIIAIGIGANEACVPWAARQPTAFKGSLNISRRDLGRTAAAVLNDAVVHGKTPPTVTIVPTTLIDATNFKTLMDPAALAKCGP